jgi:hypothetical protein
MDRQIDLRGRSGALYRFREVEGTQVRTPTGGDFAYVAVRDDIPEVVYVGATPSLSAGAHERWGEAVSRHGATHLFVRLNVSSATRDRELQDLVEGLRPPMNAMSSADGR